MIKSGVLRPGVLRPGGYEHRTPGGVSRISKSINVSLKNGYLYLNRELKLTETQRDFFITADGEAVVLTGERLSVGNKVYSKNK